MFGEPRGPSDSYKGSRIFNFDFGSHCVYSPEALCSMRQSSQRTEMVQERPHCTAPASSSPPWRKTSLEGVLPGLLRAHTC